MQYRVFDPADVMIYPHPIIDLLFAKRLALPVALIGTVAKKIPARFDKSIHRIGLSCRLTATFWAGCKLPSRVFLQRIPLASYLDIAWECDGEVLFFFHHQTALFAVNKRNRRAPVTLTTDPPIFEFVVGRFLTDFLFFKILYNRLFRFFTFKAAKLTAIK